MSELTSSTSFCINTYCNNRILLQLQKLSRAGQRLLLLSLSKLSIPVGKSYFDRSVRITFRDYSSFIQKKTSNQLIHGTVRNAFYNIKSTCDIIDKNKSKYSELTESVIIVFTEDFIDTLKVSDRVVLPSKLFITTMGNEMPNYSLALAIYSKSQKTNSKSKNLTIPIREIVELLGGKCTDYRNPPPNWKTIYVKKVKDTLHKFQKLGLIVSYCYLLDGEEWHEPSDNNKKTDDCSDITDDIYYNSNLTLKYEKMTRYYRSFIDIVVKIKVPKPRKI